MRVTALQQFLQSLIPALEASGASAKVLGDIKGVCEELEPFKDHSVETLAGFLRRAQEYEQTGLIPVVAKPSARSRTSKAAPALSVDEALRATRSLYESAIEESVTYDHIEMEVRKLDRLRKTDLDQITQELGLGKAKTKKAALDGIRDKISDYKKSHQRTQFF